MDTSINVPVHMTKNLRSQLCSVTDEKCLIVQFSNAMGDSQGDGEFSIAFSAWLKKKNRTEINIASSIIERTEIIIYWPINCIIKPSKSLIKSLEKAKFTEHSVIIIANGDWLTMKQQLKTLEKTGFLDISRGSRKNIMSRAAASSPKAGNAASEPKITKTQLRKARKMALLIQQKNIMLQNSKNTDEQENLSMQQVVCNEKKSSTDDQSGFDELDSTNKSLKTPAVMSKLSYTRLYHEQKQSGIANFDRKKINKSPVNNNQKNSAKKPMYPVNVNKNKEKGDVNSELSDDNRNEFDEQSQQNSPRPMQALLKINKNSKRVKVPSESESEQEDYMQALKKKYMNFITGEVSCDSESEQEKSEKIYFAGELESENGDGEMDATETIIMLPGLKRSIPLPDTIIKHLRKKKVQHFVSGMVDNLFEKDYLANHSPTGTVPNSFKAAGLNPKPPLYPPYVKYIRDTVEFIFGTLVGVHGKVTRALSDKISAARDSVKTKKSLRATTNTE